jgi:RimJ/RimL family protein N-acetyltransferase
MMRLFPLGRKFGLGRRTREPESADSGPQSRCRSGSHVLVIPGLRLQTPTPLDLRIAYAGASDPQAQHWLGWRPESIVPERDRERLLGTKPGRDGRGVQIGGGEHMLIAADSRRRRFIGYVSCDVQTGEIGGWLAPEFRGRGLGTVLFACAAELGHRHLGFTTVTAGTESSNKACIGVLTAAGFTPMRGPKTHTLPNGRQTEASWFRRDCDRPARCTW